MLRPLVRLLGAPLAAVAVTILRLSGRRLGIVLLYHAIGEPVRPREEDIVPPHPPSLLADQVRHLRRWYRVVEASELLDAVESRRRGERFPVAITFDDDIAAHALTALPILRAARAPATFFLCGASLEEPFAFWWERLQSAFETERSAATEVVRTRGPHPLADHASIRDLARSVEHMTRTDRREVARELGNIVGRDPDDSGIRRAAVRLLADAGMTIGFHTLDHDPLDALDDRELADALRHGRDDLERAAGRAVDSIAYPHGRTDRRVAEAARSAGFHAGFSAQGLPVREGEDALLIPRITPSYRSAGHLAVHLFLTLASPPDRREP